MRVCVCICVCVGGWGVGVGGVCVGVCMWVCPPSPPILSSSLCSVITHVCYRLPVLSSSPRFITPLPHPLIRQKAKSLIQKATLQIILASGPSSNLTSSPSLFPQPPHALNGCHLHLVTGKRERHRERERQRERHTERDRERDRQRRKERNVFFDFED